LYENFDEKVKDEIMKVGDEKMVLEEKVKRYSGEIFSEAAERFSMKFKKEHRVVSCDEK
jgi:uncharacterized protein (DUF1330 family)